MPIIPRYVATTYGKHVQANLTIIDDVCTRV